MKIYWTEAELPEFRDKSPADRSLIVKGAFRWALKQPISWLCIIAIPMWMAILQTLTAEYLRHLGFSFVIQTLSRLIVVAPFVVLLLHLRVTMIRRYIHTIETEPE